MKPSRINSDPAKVREWLNRSRRNLPRRSKKKREADKSKPEIRDAVFARDHYLCQMPLSDEARVGGGDRCFGPLTPHHIRKESQGGTYTFDNLVTLCAFHNGWVEDHPNLAHRLGLVRRAGE